MNNRYCRERKRLDREPPQPTEVLSNGVPVHHFEIRKAIRSVICDPAFCQMCSAAGNVVITLESVLHEICEICDAACSRGRLDCERLRRGIKECIGATCSVSVVVDAFCEAFCEKACQIMPTGPDPDDDCRPVKVHRVENAGLLDPPATATAQGHVLDTPELPLLQAPTVSHVRCITLENVPIHFCSAEALRPQLSAMCASCKNVSFFNTHYFEDAGKVTVSLNSASGATDLIKRINYQSFAERSTIIARPATDEEMTAMWEPLREKLIAVEAEISNEIAAYEATNPEYLRYVLATMKDKAEQVDLELAAKQNNATLAPAEKLRLLQSRLQCMQDASRFAQALVEGMHEVNGPVATMSSSSASSTNSALLLYITQLPLDMTDEKLLIFLKPFSTIGTLVHIWRDPTDAHQICCAFQSVGQVFAVLRLLDCQDFSFLKAKFARRRQLS